MFVTHMELVTQEKKKKSLQGFEESLVAADPALSHTVASPGLCGTRKRAKRGLSTWAQASAPELWRTPSTNRLQGASRDLES